jgi:hypothetical protein
VSIDSYMNIQLSGAEEWIDQQMTSVLGQVLIRYAQESLSVPFWHPGLLRNCGKGFSRIAAD